VTEPHLVQIAKGLETTGSNIGRTIVQRKGFYNAAANSLRDRLGSGSEDVFINLVEVPKENSRSGMERLICRARLRRFSILVTWMTVWRRT
jgi:Tautomerase enzyme